MRPAHETTKKEVRREMEKQGRDQHTNDKNGNNSRGIEITKATAIT